MSPLTICVCIHFWLTNDSYTVGVYVFTLALGNLFWGPYAEFCELDPSIVTYFFQLIQAMIRWPSTSLFIVPSLGLFWVDHFRTFTKRPTACIRTVYSGFWCFMVRVYYPPYYQRVFDLTNVCARFQCTGCWGSYHIRYLRPGRTWFGYGHFFWSNEFLLGR